MSVAVQTGHSSMCCLSPEGLSHNRNPLSVALSGPNGYGFGGFGDF